MAFWFKGDNHDSILLWPDGAGDQPDLDRGAGIFRSPAETNQLEAGTAVVAGVYKEDAIHLPEGVKTYPLYFKTEEVPFAIAGMSDEMPYESTVYGQMTSEMVKIFETAFVKRVKSAVEDFQPDIIVCHHLYLVTSLVREAFPETKVFGFCHNLPPYGFSIG